MQASAPDRQNGPFRHEFKYALNAMQLATLRQRLPSVLRRDPHASPSGSYEVRSLYFDDYRNSCFFDNENGTDPREKFRIRIYDGSDSTIHLECKRKFSGMTQKQSCSISRPDVEKLLRGEPLRWEDNWDPLMKKFYLWLQTRLGRPRVIVSYRRIPFIHPDGNVRVTLDLDITASDRLSSFFDPVIHGRPVMGIGSCLLEVKFDQFLPDHIHRSLQTDRLARVTFSKYYLCRKFGGSL